MGRETPNPDRPDTERGFYARHGDDPTLASYLSSLFFLLSVPSFIAIAYAGYWAGLYRYESIIPAFAGLLVASLAVVFYLMHVLTGR